jgi:hypothetical protein
VTGRDAIEKQLWRNIWDTIDHFRCRLDDMRTIVSADRLTAVGMMMSDSTGYNEDGAPYDRPGRATVVFGRAEIGADWGAQHTHFSLCPAASPSARSATSPRRPELENRDWLRCSKKDFSN